MDILYVTTLTQMIFLRMASKGKCNVNGTRLKISIATIHGLTLKYFLDRFWPNFFILKITFLADSPSKNTSK